MVWSPLATTYTVGRRGQKNGKLSIISLWHAMSEFTYYTPLGADRVPAWLLLLMAGVIFQLKKELSLHTQRLARPQPPWPLLAWTHAHSLTSTSKARLTAKSVSIFRDLDSAEGGWTLWHQQNHIPVFCLLSHRVSCYHSHLGWRIPL